MTARPRSGPPFPSAAFVGRFAAVLALLLLVVGVAACGTGSAAGGVPDEKAAQQVQVYFAGAGAHWVQGVAVQDVRVTAEPQGRTLSVRFVSNIPGDEGPFVGLYYSSVGEGGWTAGLNAAGLNLAWVDMVFDYGDGVPDTLHVVIARQAIAGSTRLRRGPTTTAAPGSTTASTASTTTETSVAGGMPPDPPGEQKQQLDSLEPAKLVETYLTTTDRSVLFYISAPHLCSVMLLPNYVPEQRHEGDIANLVIDGPREGSLDPSEYSPAEWPTQQQFTARFDLLRDRGSGFYAGPVFLFVYAGRQSADSPWRILDAGTGP